MDIIEFKNFSWTYEGYKGFTLKDINLKIKKGEFVGILGKVGSGRTSLCSSMLGIIPHFYPGKMKGEIIVDGKRISKTKIAEMSKHVGLIFQSPANQMSGAGTTVCEELAFGLENLGVPRDEMIKRVDEMVKLIGLEPFKDRSPFELSGGQQQKVAIASVLIMNPKVLVLDEPTSQLDPLGTEQVFDLIKKLSKKGMTIIMSSNKIDYLSKFADKIILLDNEVIKFASSKEMLSDINLMEKHSLMPSDLALLSKKLIEKKLWKKGIAVNLEDAKKMVEEILK